MKYSVELIEDDPSAYHVHHNCTWGMCKHRGQYRVYKGRTKIQVCLPHASEFCKRHGLRLPVKELPPETDQRIETLYEKYKDVSTEDMLKILGEE